MWKLPALLMIVVAGVIATWGGVSLASLASNGTGTSAGGGSYNVDLNVQSDPAGHDPFIFPQGTSHNIKLTVIVDGPFIQISGPSPWVTVQSQTMDAAGNFSASGSGTVAGCPNVSVTFVGTYSLQAGPLGKYTMGANGELPCDAHGQGQPVSYTVKHKPATPTPTRTPTPTPHKLYSIIVIKVNDNTLERVPEWQMSLYTGAGCPAGISPLTQFTNGQGLTDFEGLEPGTYSVKEGSRTNWNPDGPICQDVTVGPASGAGVPPCPIPNNPFPQPGCDSFQSVAKVIVTIDGTAETSTANLFGPTLIERMNKPTPVGGHDTIDTEIISMELTGSGMTVHLAPGTHSTGKITEQTNATPGTMEFPADSFFDVFVEVDLGQLTLHNKEPLHMECVITEIPPYKCFYEPPFAPIGLYNADQTRIATLIHGFHMPIPPNEKVVIFSNRPKGTPTVTPTRTRTPTATQTPCGAVGAICTPTPTRTPTPAGGPTATPTPCGVVAICTPTPTATPCGVNGAICTPTPTATPCGVNGAICTPTPTATPTHPTEVTPTPTNKPPNGGCLRINPIGQTVQYQGQTWESQWSCSRNAAVGPYNRVDIIVAEIQGVPRVDQMHFECTTTHEKATGVFKFHKTTDPLSAVTVDWWSADFLQKCDGKVMVYFKPLDPNDHTIGPAYPVFKNTPRTPTPTPANPPPNGDCVKTKQNVTFQNKQWDLWSCSPTLPPPFEFSRVDISVAVGAPPATKLSAVHMVCQATNEKMAGVFKAHKSNVNVQPGQPPDHEVWSVQFSHKCRQKVLVYLQTVNPDNHAVIKEVAFTNPTQPTATPTRTPTRTPTPRPHNGDGNKDGTTNPVDAALVLQYSAGLIGTINASTDVNNDGRKDPVDAALILQFSADLIHQLPV